MEEAIQFLDKFFAAEVGATKASDISALDFKNLGKLMQIKRLIEPVDDSESMQEYEKDN